jgi:hypothetical protein
MAADNLKQTGKVIGKTRNTADYAVKRVQKNFPIIERVRDSFDVEHPFVMEFLTNRDEQDVTITIQISEAFEFTC